MVSFLFLLNNSLDFGNVLFPTVPLCYPVKDLFRVIHLVMVHQNVRRLLKEKVKHDKQCYKGYKLEYDDKEEPV